MVFFLSFFTNKTKLHINASLNTTRISPNDFRLSIFIPMSAIENIAQTANPQTFHQMLPDTG